VGIATVEAYQRQGIASALASALVDHAFANGYTEVGWHCWADNAGSAATARKAGLEKMAEYPVYIVTSN
jgi:RimJ/RimL family protein N-acetyltransferase